MSFYIRKSIRVGFLRFNLSNAGIGVSAGVPGFRVGTGPRGTYIHAGRGGIYYRETLNRPAPIPTRPQDAEQIDREILPRQAHTPVMREIESGEVSKMVDSSSARLLAQINASRSKLSLAPWVFVAASIAAFFAYPRVPIIWSFPVVAALTVLARFLDIHRKTCVLMYDFQEPASATVQAFHQAFDQLTSARRLWHVSASGGVASRDRKYQAGATTLVGRKTIGVSLGEPSFVRTNIPVPRIPVGKQTLHFLPDVLLVVDGKKVGGVSYESLRAEVTQSNFIETEGVPSDSEVVDRTWRYVNKAGGPDRRFKDNPQIPVVRYEELHLRSDTGLNELLQISRVGTGNRFAMALRSLSTIGRETRETVEPPPPAKPASTNNSVLLPMPKPIRANMTPLHAAECVRESILNLFEVIDRVAAHETPQERDKLREEAQEVVLGLVCAIVAADGRFDVNEQAFFREIVDSKSNPGGDVSTLREYAERWRTTPPRLPSFIESAMRFDAAHGTETARDMMRELQLAGNNAGASDGRLAVCEQEVIRNYLAFLESHLEAGSTG